MGKDLSRLWSHEKRKLMSGIKNFGIMVNVALRLGYVWWIMRKLHKFAHKGLGLEGENV